MSPLPKAASASAWAWRIAAVQGLAVDGDAHPPPAAAGHGLDQHREADLLGDRQRFLLVGHDAVAPRARWARRSWRASLRAAFLSPKRAMASCGGPMNSMLQLRQTSAKCGVLGQKAVARMDRLHVADLGGADHPIHLQIAVGRLRRADAEGLVGQFRGTPRRGRPR